MKIFKYLNTKGPIFTAKEWPFRIRKRFYRTEAKRNKRQRSKN